MTVLSGFLIVLGASCWIAALAGRATRDLLPPRRWADAWNAWAPRGTIFSLAGFGGFASGLWKLPFFGLALGLMAASALIDLRWKRHVSRL